MRRMVERVVVRDENQNIHVLSPGDSVPEWADGQVGGHAAETVPARRATTRKTTKRKSGAK